jgi:hypothetical protein
MIRKKSGFLTFCFAFIPGAGQMYMGFMKRGISLMSSFILLIFAAVWMHFGPLLLALPVIWFYAFFDTFNLHATPDDEFYAMEDNYILFPDFAKKNTLIPQGKYRNIFAFVLIFIGITILWNNLFDIFDGILPSIIRDALHEFGHYFPQLIVALAIIALGIYLINGKKKELDTEDKLPRIEDKGGLL